MESNEAGNWLGSDCSCWSGLDVVVVVVAGPCFGFIIVGGYFGG